MKAALLFSLVLLLFLGGCATRRPALIDRPILFDAERIALTRDYMRRHYGIESPDGRIVPRIIVIHHTATDTLEEAYDIFYPARLRNRSDIAGASALNVSAHYLVDRDGTIYRLMPPDLMARHVIGLNWCSVGIENVGKGRLTRAQLEADTRIVRELTERFSTIRYLIGHYEYRRFEKTPLWREKDPSYRTLKHDPPPAFLEALRRRFPDLKGAP